MKKTNGNSKIDYINNQNVLNLDYADYQKAKEEIDELFDTYLEWLDDEGNYVNTIHSPIHIRAAEERVAKKLNLVVDWEYWYPSV